MLAQTAMLSAQGFLGSASVLPLGTQQFLKTESKATTEKFTFADDLKRPSVIKQIEYFSNPQFRNYFGINLHRSNFFYSYFEEVLDKYDVPHELMYLPAIESVYDPRAVSYAGARGLWQFMSNSVAPYSMRMNQWQDDRQDFWLATDAAIDKLIYNYKKFDNDWYLALAAYNSGANRIARLLRETGATTFWELVDKGVLPKQTVDYVPKFIAVSYLLWQEDRSYPHVEWTRVKLDQALDLRLLAKQIDIPFDVLAFGNSELKYGVSPPGNTNYYLKIPAVYKQDVEDVLSATDIPLLKFYRYKIKSGDTLSHLAAYYDVSVSLIQQYNHNIKPEAVRIDQVLLVPALKEMKPYVGKSTDLGDLPVWRGRYRIKDGDTLWGIAVKYSVDPLVLAAVNKMSLNDVLDPSKIIIVPSKR